MSDISDLLTGDSQPEDDHRNTPRETTALAESEPADDTMTPVQKIRAYKQGAIEFPDIVPAETTIADDTAASGTEPDIDTTAELPSEDQDSQPIKAAPTEIKEFFRTFRKPVLVIAALLVVGGGLYVSGATAPKSDDKSTPAAAPTTTTPTTTTTPGSSNTESLIKPASAEFTPHEVCGPGSTPAIDAFSGQKDTAAVCENQLGIVPGTTMTITLPSLTRVEDISTIAGFPGKDTDKKDNWTKYPLLSSVLWYFDNAEPQPQHFTTDRKSQPLKLAHPVYTKTIRLVVLETAQAPKTESGSTATTTPNNGIFGDLGDWGKGLGGKSSPTTGAPTATAPAPGVTAFAVGPIRITGRPAD